MKYERPFNVVPPGCLKSWSLEGAIPVSQKIRTHFNETGLFETKAIADKICRRLNMLHQKETCGSIDPKLLKRWYKEEEVFQGCKLDTSFMGSVSAQIFGPYLGGIAGTSGPLVKP